MFQRVTDTDIRASTDRFSKTVSGVTTNFLYDGGNVTEEMQGTTVTADYGANAEKLSGTVYWMLQDGQPSTRQLLNSSQAIVSSYLNDAYGNNISSSGSAANSFKWNGGSGYYSDAESGLQKIGARYYDPSVGNWISQDTMLIAGRPNDRPGREPVTPDAVSVVGGTRIIILASSSAGVHDVFEKLPPPFLDVSSSQPVT